MQTVLPREEAVEAIFFKNYFFTTGLRTFLECIF